MQPSARSVAWVRAAIADLPDPRVTLTLDPAMLDGPSLLKLTLHMRALLRDAVLRTAKLPQEPEWNILSCQADDVVRLDLATVSAVAAWLDEIGDRATI